MHKEKNVITQDHPEDDIVPSGYEGLLFSPQHPDRATYHDTRLPHPLAVSTEQPLTPQEVLAVLIATCHQPQRNSFVCHAGPWPKDSSEGTHKLIKKRDQHLAQCQALMREQGRQQFTFSTLVQHQNTSATTDPEHLAQVHYSLWVVVYGQQPAWLPGRQAHYGCLGGKPITHPCIALFWVTTANNATPCANMIEMILCS